MARRKTKPGKIETIYTGDRVSLRANLLRSGKRSLFLAINPIGAPDNKRVFRTLKLYLTGDREADRETLALAKQSVREVESDLFQHPELALRQNQRRSFLDFVEDLAKEKDGRGHSWASLLSHLKAFAAGSDILFSYVNTEWIKKFRAFLLSRVAQSSASLYYSNLLTAVRQALRDRMLDFDPTLGVPPIRKKQARREYLTIEELRTLADTPCRRSDVRRAFLFACYTGLRLSDVKSLTWSMIRENEIIIEMKKTGTTLQLPLGDSAKGILGEDGAKDETVFPLPAESTVSDVLKTWARDAGIQKTVTFHISRHTFATMLIASGADVYVVSKLLGHADVRVTQIYAKMVDSRKQAAVDLLPNLEQEHDCLPSDTRSATSNA